MSTGYRTARSSAPRSSHKYNNAVHGQGESNLPPGDLTLNTQLCPIRLFRPKWTDKAMVFRPWPCLDEENPTRILPGRTEIGVHALSQWIVRVSAVKYVGIGRENKVTFILYDPVKGIADDNPYKVLYWGLMQAFKQRNPKFPLEWANFVEGKEKYLSAATSLYFTQGYMYTNGDKLHVSRDGTPFGMGSDDALPVQQIPASAGRAIYNLFDIEKPPETVKGDPSVNPSALYRYGDPVGRFQAKKEAIGPGWFMTVFRPKFYPNLVEDSSYDPAKAAKNDGSFESYEVALSRELPVGRAIFTPELQAAAVQTVKDRWQFWWPDETTSAQGLLRIPCEMELASILAKALSKIPEALEFAWSDHKKYLNQDVLGILRSRSSTLMPGGDDEDDDDLAGNEAAYARAKKTVDPVVSGGSARFGALPPADDDEDEDDVPVASSRRPAAVAADVEDDDEDTPVAAPPRAVQGKADGSRRRVALPVEEVEEEFADTVAEAVDEDDEEEFEDEDDADEVVDEEEEEPAPVPVTAAAAKKRTRFSQGDDDEDMMPAPRTPGKAKTAAVVADQSAEAMDALGADTAARTKAMRDTLAAAKARGAKRASTPGPVAPPPPVVDEEEEEEEEEAAAPPPKQKLSGSSRR